MSKTSWLWALSLGALSLVDNFNELAEESCFSVEQQQAAAFITVTVLLAGFLSSRHFHNQGQLL